MTVQYIKDLAFSHYDSFLQYFLKTLCLSGTASQNKDEFFPLEVFSLPAADIGNEEKQNQEENREVFEQSKNKTGCGYTLKAKIVQTRSFGLRISIESIFFESPQDFACTIEKTQEVDCIKSAVLALKDIFAPEADFLYSWAQNHAELIVKSTPHAQDAATFWESIADAALSLKEDTRKETLPQDLADFIAQNASLLQTLLPQKDLLPFLSSSPSQNKNDSSAQNQHFIRFRFLSLDHPLRLGNFTPQEISLRQDDFSLLEKSGLLEGITHILVVQNEVSYLRFPHFEHTISILGEEATLKALTSFSWLSNFKLVFFGDISEEGLQYLSLLRTAFRSFYSLCMGKDTLNFFAASLSRTPPLENETIPRFLTAGERETFLFLRHNTKQNCLLQEKIPIDYVAKEFATLFSKKEEL